MQGSWCAAGDAQFGYTVPNLLVGSNFHDYPMLKLADMPHVDTVIVPAYDFRGGVGEPTICVVAPCVMNAVFAATGKPVRSLPMKNLKLV